MTTAAQNTVLEVVRLRPVWVKPLQAFHASLQACGDTRLFSPHPFSASALSDLCNPARQDLHYVLTADATVIGYGLLRGWDEGFSTPSLGIAIDPVWRGIGLSRTLMHFLHSAARAKGATRVRLRVHPSNAAAISLYRNLDYQFEVSVDRDGLWVANKQLQP